MSRSTRPIAYSLFFGFILSLSACGPNYHFSESVAIPDENWTYGNPIDFQFQIEDTLQIYNLILDITHHQDYSYQNLYTRIGTYFPSGQDITNTLSLELADKTGRWQGKCSGKYCTVQIPIQEGAYFNAAGDYKIRLEQFMRKDPIAGIKDISFHIEKTENRRGN